MKKIAVMTWYQHRNYGTTLQAAALIRTVEKLGYKAYGVDYISNGYAREVHLQKFFSIRRISIGIKHQLAARKYKAVSDLLKQQRYDLFMKKYIPMEQSTQTLSQLFLLNEKYDAFLCGSDQIWTPAAFNSKYFLDFVENDSKKIAYAPSFGLNDIRNRYAREKIGNCLAKFPALSIREEQGAKLIKNYYGLNAKVVLDPTLLLEREEWECYSCEVKEKRNMLLCYFLGEKESYWAEVEKIAAENRLDIYVIPVHIKDYYRGYNILTGIGPGEFLNELSQAKLVCTDSYHGTVFSVIFKRNFITFKRFSERDPASQNSRLLDLLKRINLEDHLWNRNYKLLETEWESVHGTLDTLKKESLGYLSEALYHAALSETSSINRITNTCCGCGICKKVCSHNAISMEEVNGFYQAVVDSEQCIGCGMCRKVCAFNGDTGSSLQDAQLYESKSRNRETRYHSTSGGIAYEIASTLSKQSFPVFGCLFDYESGDVRHDLVCEYDKEKLSKFQGSKYLQSKFFEGNFTILDMKKGVMFGTPCQIAAADHYLRLMKKRGQFVLVDLVCHGVPSKNLWRTYLHNMGFSEDQLSEVYFRTPKYGWKRVYIHIASNNRSINRKKMTDLFYQFFDMKSCLMQSCYECNYRESSKADIRLGDYWGKEYTEDDLRYGVSMVVAFTDTGTKLLQKMKESGDITLLEQPIEDYYKGQGPVNPIIPLYYEALLEDLKSCDKNLSVLLYKYCKMEHWNQYAHLCLAKIRTVFRK